MRSDASAQWLLARLMLAIGAGSLVGVGASCGGAVAPRDEAEESHDDLSASPVGGGGGAAAPSTGENPGPGGGGTASGGAGFGGGSASGGAGEVQACEYGAPSRFCLSVPAMEQMARAGFGQVALDPLRTDAEVAAGFDANGCLRHDWVGSSCCNPALGPGAREGDECCYNSCEGVCCGRALVVAGRPVVASAASRSDWLTTLPHGESGSEAAALSEQERAALGSLWLGDALLEHASIASFARFTLQLLAVGAPAHLVASAQAAGLDEVKHAELAFAIASRLTGKPLGPGGLVAVGHELSLDLMQVMIATIHEGCVGETLSALVALERARVAGDASIRAALETIAADESRHAELAFRFVAWAIQQGGAVFEAAARLAFEQALGAAFDVAATADVSEPVLHHYGRLSAREEGALMARGAEQVLWPAARALLSERSRAQVALEHAPA